MKFDMSKIINKIINVLYIISNYNKLSISRYT